MDPHQPAENHLGKRGDMTVNGNPIADATSAVFSQLANYVMTVAKKHGHQEAFDLLSSAYTQYGTQIGGMLKPQFEGQEANAQDIFGVMGPMEESVGFEFEVTDSTPEKVTAKFTRCPLYEGCQAVGAPHEEFCNNLGLPFVNAIAQVLNPNAVWKDVRHRESADDYCLEEIAIE
jgi:hypothetical protein